MPAPTKSSIFKTCRPEELEQLTRQGWSLKSVLSNEKTIEVLDDIAAWDKGSEPNSSGYGQYRSPGWQHTSVPRKVVAAETLFLLEQNEGSVVAELEQKIGDLQGQLGARWTEVEQQNKQIEELKKESGRKDEEIKRYSGYLDSAQKEARTLRETKDRMERDIAKIQRAVGEIRFQEIVGGPVPASR